MAQYSGGYQQPQDTYMHNNASQYDNQYEMQGYRDEPGYGGGHQTPHSDYYGSGGEGAKESGRGAGAGAGAGAAGAGYNPAQQSAAKYSYAQPKKGRSKAFKWGIIALIAILVIAGAVLGGVFGSRAANSGSSGSGGSSGDAPGTDSSFSGESAANRVASIPSGVADAASAAASAGGKNNIFYDGTDAYGNPYWVSSNLDSSAPAQGEEVVTCSDSNAPSGTLSATALRQHPRLMTSGPEWSCLPEKISRDAYLTMWNASIFENATTYLNMPPTAYDVDGGFATGSGILDPAREVQLRIKTLAYAYRLSNDSQWLERTWTELEAAAGNSTAVPWNAQTADPSITQTNYTWNPQHFLDTAELTAAFAIGYDWLYDAWTDERREQIMWSIINLGLLQGVHMYTTGGAWWAETANGNGNWNCVCNSGLILGALAIWENDPTGNAQYIMDNAVPNMRENCMRGAYSDGTWSETANYWYFGANAQARALSALISATGSDQGLSAANPGWNLTGQFHMYVGGHAGLFAYGDNGPNKYATTANGMFLWGKLSNTPVYSLYQRDRADAADPLSMFWYDTGVTGSFWNGLALDRFFDNTEGSWASMRSSWTDFTGTYIGIKSSNGTGHQTHGDLDAGDFVIDALGTRWAGEYGNGNYLSTDYFTSEAADSERWEYYRKGTQGQNTLVINNGNQQPDCLPVNAMQTTSVAQSSDVNFVVATDDIAYFTTDMSSCYGQASGTVVRGIRFLNGRRQILVQDEVGSGSGITSVQWRVQTNATISLSSNGTTATMTISQVRDPNAWGNTSDPLVAQLPATRTMVVSLLSPASATFAVESPPARMYGSDPNTATGEDGDQPNPGVSVLKIDMPSPSGTVEVLWQPQWGNLGDADRATPSSVALSDWSLTSHNA